MTMLSWVLPCSSRWRSPRTPGRHSLYIIAGGVDTLRRIRVTLSCARVSTITTNCKFGQPCATQGLADDEFFNRRFPPLVQCSPNGPHLGQILDSHYTTSSTSARQSRDTSHLYDLYDLYDLYELYALYDLAHVAGWEPYNMTRMIKDMFPGLDPSVQILRATSYNGGLGCTTR